MTSIEQELKNKIRNIANYPFPNAMLRDVSPLLADPVARAQAMQLAASALEHQKIDIIAGIEPRGTLVAPFLAAALNKPYIVIRKQTKLPNTQSITYQLPFGPDTLEVSTDDVPQNANILIVDDILAIGASVIHAAKLMQQCGAQVAGIFCLIELDALNGKQNIAKEGFTATTVLHY